MTVSVISDSVCVSRESVKSSKVQVYAHRGPLLCLDPQCSESNVCAERIRMQDRRERLFSSVHDCKGAQIIRVGRAGWLGGSWNSIHLTCMYMGLFMVMLVRGTTVV